VQEFVNTVDLEEGVEQLSDPAALRAWLVGHDLASTDDRCTRADLQRAVAVREGLRALLLHDAGDDTDSAAEAVLDGAAQRARFAVHFQAGTAHLEPAAVGVDGAIGRLLAIVTTSMADGTWARLKACRSGTCQWAFYDHSRNGSGAWCDMAICGSREKMRTYRRRRQSAG
jgi:predicted RNA-binding Zn ribbon-like protein